MPLLTSLGVVTMVAALCAYEYDVWEAYFVSKHSLQRGRATEAASNVIKSAVLLCLSAYSLWSGRGADMVLRDRFNPTSVQITVGTYALLDGLSLWRVPVLSRSTRIHHWGVVVSATWMLLGNDWSDGGVHASRLAKCLFGYGLFSSYAYAVNALLAVRRVVKPDTHLRYPALGVYVVTCAVNWSYQLIWLWSMHWLLWLPFLGLLWTFVQDDLVLMAWLYHGRSSSPASTTTI